MSRRYNSLVFISLAFLMFNFLALSTSRLGTLFYRGASLNVRFVELSLCWLVSFLVETRTSYNKRMQAVPFRKVSLLHL